MKSLFTVKTFCMESAIDRVEYEELKWLLEYHRKPYKEFWKDEYIICVKYESQTHIFLS